MNSLLWHKDDNIKAVEIEKPNDLHDVFYVKVKFGRRGGTFRHEQYPAADIFEAETKAHTIMQGYRDNGFTFLGRGNIDKKKRDYFISVDATDMKDPLMPSTYQSLSKINGAFARQRKH